MRPSAEIGRRNGSASTASSGKASSWERISTTSAPITTAAPSTAATTTPGLSDVAAIAGLIRAPA